jgi:hypothetical protein
MSNESQPIQLRPNATADGRVDIAGVRWTIEHMRAELAENADLARVRNALAIALLEIDRAQQKNAALGASGPIGSRFQSWLRRT